MSDFMSRMTTNHPSLLKEKWLEDKKLRENETMVSSNPRLLSLAQLLIKVFFSHTFLEESKKVILIVFL